MERRYTGKVKKTMPQEKDKKRIRGYLQEARKTLFLSHWDFSLEFAKEDVIEKGYNVDAECSAKWEYEEATITRYPCFWKSTPEYQRRVVFHEVAHCITQPINIIYRAMINGKIITDDEKCRLNEWMTSKIAVIALDRNTKGDRRA